MLGLGPGTQVVAHLGGFLAGLLLLLLTRIPKSLGAASASSGRSDMFIAKAALQTHPQAP